MRKAAQMISFPARGMQVLKVLGSSPSAVYCLLGLSPTCVLRPAYKLRANWCSACNPFVIKILRYGKIAGCDVCVAAHSSRKVKAAVGAQATSVVLILRKHNQKGENIEIIYAILRHQVDRTDLTLTNFLK